MTSWNLIGDPNDCSNMVGAIYQCLESHDIILANNFKDGQAKQGLIGPLIWLVTLCRLWFLCFLFPF